MEINSQYGRLNISDYTIIKGIEKTYHSKETTNGKKYNLDKQNKKQFDEILKDKIAKTK